MPLNKTEIELIPYAFDSHDIVRYIINYFRQNIKDPDWGTINSSDIERYVDDQLFLINLELASKSLYKEEKVIYADFAIDNVPLHWLLIYLFMGVLGIVANVITCIVIVTNTSLRTTINYYLLNLAISDLMILIWNYPPLIMNYSGGSRYMCILRGTMAESSISASVFTITVFTMERYLAVCHPFVARRRSGLFRASLVLPLIWLLALILGLVWGLQVHILHHQSSNNETRCGPIGQGLVYSWFELNSALRFFGPMLLICVLHALIAAKLRKSEGRRVSGAAGRTSRVSRLLVAVAVIFFISWAPYHLVRLMMRHYEYFGYGLRRFLISLYTVSPVLYYMSAIVNPILYNLMSSKFRRGFKETAVKIYKILQLSNKYVNGISVLFQRRRSNINL